MKPQPLEIEFIDIRKNILNGTYVIPAFQRDFVWDISASAKLLDSWVKGYPLGSFIFWKSSEYLCPVKKIGNILIYENQSNTEKTYILDGQQRITSVFAAIMGLEIGRKNKFTDIVVNLDVDVDDKDKDVVLVRPENSDINCISFSELCGEELMPVLNKFPEDYKNKIIKIRDRLGRMRFHAIMIEGASIEVATEIFSRLNTGGKKLDCFDIMVAKTYRHEENGVPEFNLAKKTDEYIKTIPSPYINIIDRKALLKMAALCIKKDVSRKAQLSITRDEMISAFDDVKKAINSAINFCVSSLKVPVAKMIAYSSIFELYVYYFYNYNKNNNLKNPSLSQQKFLIDYYWRCVITERFGSSTDTKTAEDAKNVIDKILLDATPVQSGVMLSVGSLIDRGEFKTNRAFIIGLLGLLMSKNPKSLANNSLVVFDAKWISNSQKNNYHHFFPEKMIGNQWTNEPVNNICNIILQDASTNQVDIGNRRPSDYISDFCNTNMSIVDTLKEHLIMDIDEFGIKSDDFDMFIKKRAAAIIEELKSRLVYDEAIDNIDSTIR